MNSNLIHQQVLLGVRKELTTTREELDRLLPTVATVRTKLEELVVVERYHAGALAAESQTKPTAVDPKAAPPAAPVVKSQATEPAPKTHAVGAKYAPQRGIEPASDAGATVPAADIKPLAVPGGESAKSHSATESQAKTPESTTKPVEAAPKSV
jgi:hypothetical protein